MADTLDQRSKALAQHREVIHNLHVKLDRLSDELHVIGGRVTAIADHFGIAS